jgi:hypothetical protein
MDSPVTDVEFEKTHAYMDSLANRKLESVADIKPPFRTFEELLAHVRRLDSGRWVFRGQPRDWPLRPLLERITKPGARSRVEHLVEQQFLRRAHQYHTYGELPAGSLVTHSLMRHHGAPTRLLDFTKSPYVAAFFAAADAHEAASEDISDTDCVIWAINCDSLHVIESGDGVSARRIPHNQDDRYTLLQTGIDYWPPIVTAIEPIRMNERLAAQQGVFLVPSTVDFSFESCLIATIERVRSQNPYSSRPLQKLVLRSQARCDTLKELNRMNISWATLRPGLDGFCEMLCTFAELHSRLDDFQELLLKNPVL